MDEVQRVDPSKLMKITGTVDDLKGYGIELGKFKRETELKKAQAGDYPKPQIFISTKDIVSNYNLRRKAKK